ncbi:peptidylprolyl isomerase [Pseudodesulfovibrio cashew]|uniref:peptidylprolyl isomerase n=1 Tax=Pseudodesulfovibrio cashew TaxID=2678688 RepID=A0A6I6J9L9_9BACT|nr:peptidylprolyl isomerase [Pseudodesulfovibrio cashew]QGY39335.1 peptidylprolyl isomerase [Pseudodesulfovibrio cashew]
MNAFFKQCCFLTLLCLLAAGLLLVPANSEAAGPNPVVIMETSMGRIIVMLYPKDAPVTVKNFLRYVDAGFYDGTIFHRVVQQEVNKDNPLSSINIVQGGGFVPPMRMKRPLWSPIINESAMALQNKAGTISMARTSDPNSATSQFFFNVLDNPALNSRDSVPQYAERDEYSSRTGYCAFGKVIRGMQVVEEMLKVKTGRSSMYKDVPLKPIYLTKVYRAK